MSDHTQENTSGIIASLISIPCNTYHMDKYITRIAGLPLSEIEVDLDTLDKIEKFQIDESILITTMINYPLGGYQAEYILDAMRWAVNRKTNLVCTGLPLSWLRSDMENKLAKLLKSMIEITQKEKIRISVETSLLSNKEISRICKLLEFAGIFQLKTSSGLPHLTPPDKLSFIRSTYPALLLTVDNNLRGDSPEIDNLFHLGANCVCIKEPWLYHF